MLGIPCHAACIWNVCGNLYFYFRSSMTVYTGRSLNLSFTHPGIQLWIFCRLCSSHQRTAPQLCEENCPRYSSCCSKAYSLQRVSVTKPTPKFLSWKNPQVVDKMSATLHGVYVKGEEELFSRTFWVSFAVTQYVLFSIQGVTSAPFSPPCTQYNIFIYG